MSTSVQSTKEGAATGAVLIDGEIVCFDISDFDLQPGDEAVVIRGNRIEVATLTDFNQDTYCKRRGKSRVAYVPTVSGCYPPGTKEKAQVMVLGRYVPRHAPAAQPKQRALVDARKTDHLGMATEGAA